MTGNGDLQSHQATYNGMIGVFKWGAIACAIIVLFVLWLIAG